MKPYVKKFMQSLANMELKPKNDAAYSNWIDDYVKYLASKTVEISSRTIMEYLGEYRRGVLRNADVYQDAYEKVLGPDPFLGDFEWAIDTTIKENRYARFKIPPTILADSDVIRDIARKALQLPYDDAINFIGEIAGAWVLTYPIVSMKRYVQETFKSARGWPSAEEDFAYILRRLLEIELYEWRR